MDELTKERLIQNELTFREANERIREAAGTIGLDDTLPFICECSDASCTEVVLVELSRYVDVRRDPGQFIHAPGHISPIGRVVEEHESFIVVEKDL